MSSSYEVVATLLNTDEIPEVVATGYASHAAATAFAQAQQQGNPVEDGALYFYARRTESK